MTEKELYRESPFMERLFGKSCPFCGNDEVFTASAVFFNKLVEDNGTSCLSVKCPDCGVEIKTYGHTDYHAARLALIKMWNRRV